FDECRARQASAGLFLSPRAALAGRRRSQPARLTGPRERVACSAAMAVTETLPDGKALELKDGATGADAAAAIGPGLARAALAVEVSQPEAGESPEVRDLARALPDGARVAILTDKSGDSALQLIRHDA